MIRPLIDSPTRLESHQLLAAAVLRQAMTDAINSDVTPAERDTARYFLADSTALQFWCSVAGLDARVIAARAAERALQRAPNMRVRR